MCAYRSRCPVSAIVWNNSTSFLWMTWIGIAEKGPPIWRCPGKGDINNQNWNQSALIELLWTFSSATVGVVCHFWYKFLDKRMPGRNLTIVLKKVFWDQLICSPIVISTFFLTLGVLEKSSREEVIAEIKSKAWKLYAGKLCVRFWWINEATNKKSFTSS